MLVRILIGSKHGSSQMVSSLRDLSHIFQTRCYHNFIPLGLLKFRKNGIMVETQAVLHPSSVEAKPKKTINSFEKSVPAGRAGFGHPCFKNLLGLDRQTITKK